MADHNLPLQTSTGKEESSCWDAQTGHDCFLCSIVTFVWISWENDLIDSSFSTLSSDYTKFSKSREI